MVSWPFINPPTFPNSVNFWGCGPLFSNITQKIQFSASVISFYYRYFFIKNRFFLSVLPRFTYCGELCLPASFDLPAFTSETPRDSIFVARSVLSAEKVLEPGTSTDTVKAFNFLQVTDVSARSQRRQSARGLARGSDVRRVMPCVFTNHVICLGLAGIHVKLWKHCATVNKHRKE